jgi:hypothetical protein
VESIRGLCWVCGLWGCGRAGGKERRRTNTMIMNMESQYIMAAMGSWKTKTQRKKSGGSKSDEPSIPYTKYILITHRVRRVRLKRRYHIGKVFLLWQRTHQALLVIRGLESERARDAHLHRCRLGSSSWNEERKKFPKRKTFSVRK